MKPRQLFRSVFPPPRRRLRVAAALPLAVFLVVFAGACLFLDLSSIITFSSPSAFFLSFVLPWIWWMHFAGSSGLTGARSLTSLMVRFLVVAAFIMLIAEPRAVRTSKALSVTYALDVSDSVGESNVEQALRFVVKTASEKPSDDRAGLVVLGRTAAVELPPRTTFPYEAINSRLDRDGTNLEKGLSLAAVMCSDETPARIVLVTDGVETEGNLTAILDELKAREIPVDVLPVQYDYAEEVWLEKLELPRFVKEGETYEASVILSSLRPGRGRLTLKENGEVTFEDTVDFEQGKNRYVLPLMLREPGYYEYVASIATPPGRDHRAENNVAIGHLYLKGKGKALVVTDPLGDRRDWEALVQAMREGKVETELCSAHEFPRDVLSLLPYDCIVFPNVPADALDVAQVQAVHDAVYSQGAGFVMVGGKNSFGPGGYHRTPVEQALPVSMDISKKKVLPKGALVIILHTCEFPQGNTWGKRIAKEAIRVLGAKDEVGVLVYDWQGREKWLFNLTPASEYPSLVQKINNAEIGDMPSFATTMRMGLDALKASEAAMKHMIIISDGDPSPPLPALVDEFVTEKISITMVAISPHDPAGGSDIAVMKSIASQTSGRFHFPGDPSLLPSIFIKEAKTLKQSMIQNKVIVPLVSFPSPILKGIDAIPELKAYVLTTPKPRATTILKTPETEEVEPVLATWRYGLGKSAAFTSDLSPNWGAEWVRWDRYQAFVKQLIADVARVEHESSLHLRTFASGSTGVILVEDSRTDASFLEMAAQVVGPRQQAQTVPVKQVGPRRYQGRFPLWGKGRYQVSVLGAGGGRSERAIGGFAVPYSPEYLRFRSNPILIEQIAQRTNGRILTGAETGEDIFVKKREPRTSTRPIVDLFLICLACLIPLDVGVRRIQLDWQVIRRWFGAEERVSGETFSALLMRKRELQSAQEQMKDERRAPVLRRARLTPTQATPPASPAKQTPEEREPQGPSTTERLLAKKRKWKQDDDQATGM